MIYDSVTLSFKKHGICEELEENKFKCHLIFVFACKNTSCKALPKNKLIN